jgi:hypothetical protein
MDQSSVILRILFPADFQRPETIVPRVGALDHPASGGMTATGDWDWLGFAPPSPMGNVHAIPQTADDPMDFVIVVSFVGAEMAHNPMTQAVTPRAPNDQVEQGHLSTLVVRHIRRRERHREWHAPPIDQDMPLAAQLGAIGRIFAVLAPPNGAGMMALSKICQFHAMPHV